MLGWIRVWGNVELVSLVLLQVTSHWRLETVTRETHCSSQTLLLPTSGLESVVTSVE